MDSLKNKGLYIPHYNLEGLCVKFSIFQLHDEKKILNQYLKKTQFGQKSAESHIEIYIEAQLIINQKPINPPQRHAIEKKMLLSQDIIFNFNYTDLAYNSIIAITIWASNKDFSEQKPLGSTIVSLFDEEFKLRQGKIHLFIWPDTLPDISFDSKTSGLIQDSNIEDIKNTVKKISYYQDTQTTQLQNQIINQLNLKLHYTSQKVPAAFLEIEFPKFEIPVFFEDKSGSDDFIQNITDVGRQKKLFYQNSAFADCIISADFEFENGLDDPAQEQYNLLDTYENNAQNIKPNQKDDSKIKKAISKPTLGELDLATKKLFYRYRYSLTNNPDALVKFLHSVQWSNTREKEESIVMLQKWAPLSWGDALHVLSSFFCANDIFNKKNKKPIEQMRIIRKYAVDQLKKVSQDKIYSILLQLVQALKYEDLTRDLQQSPLAQFLIELGCNNLNIATQLLWILSVETDNEGNNSQQQVNSSSSNNNILNKDKLSVQETEKIQQWFLDMLQLFKQSLEEKNPEIFNLLESQEQLRSRLKDTAQKMKDNGKDINQKKNIVKEELKEYTNNLQKSNFCLFPEMDLEDPVPEKTKIFMSAMAPMLLTWNKTNRTESTNSFNSSSNNDSESLNNSKKQQEQQQEKIRFIYKTGDDLRQDQLILQVFQLMETLFQEVNQDFRLTPYKVLACSKNDGFMEFVSDSDTLQNILSTKDSLLKYFEEKSKDPTNMLYKDYEGFGVKGREKEITEQIQNEIDQNTNPSFDSSYYSSQGSSKAETQASISDSNSGSQTKSNNNSATQKIHKKIMENYILSCAGYCVITYLLGIGDRHQENIMIQDTGKMLHIDFGFILGKDPKLGAPHFKLSPGMVNGMGGKQHDNYKIFKRKCVDTYKYLRKYCKLIVTFFQLMLDAGILDVTQEAIAKMVEKFCLDETDDRAEKFFLNILEESVAALMDRLNDKFHIIAGYFRK